MDQCREITGCQALLVGVIAYVPMGVEVLVQRYEEVLENLVLAGLLHGLHGRVGNVSVDDLVTKCLYESRDHLFAQGSMDIFPAAHALYYLLDAPVLLPSKRHMRVKADIDVALGIGDGIERGKYEVEIGRSRHTLQVCTETFYLRMCESRVNVQIARTYIVYTIVQHEGDVPATAQQETHLLKIADCLLDIDVSTVNVEQLDVGSSYCIHIYLRSCLQSNKKPTKSIDISVHISHNRTYHTIFAHFRFLLFHAYCLILSPKSSKNHI